MAHQVNLYSPILLAPRRLFSALAMAQAFGVLVLGLALLAGWSAFSAARLRGQLASAVAFDEAEARRLQTVIDGGSRAGPASATALEQELAREKALLQQRQRQLAELMDGLAEPASAPSALLDALARTLPASMWLSDAHFVDGRLELSGYTLEPEAIRPWLAALRREPFAATMPLALLRVERAGGVAARDLASDGVVWAFSAGPQRAESPPAPRASDSKP